MVGHFTYTFWVGCLILAYRDDGLVSFEVPYDLASFAILGHIPLSFG